MKYKKSVKSFISAYNHRMCTSNVYGGTGNKQTNTRTLAFYKGIDVISSTSVYKYVISSTSATCHWFGGIKVTANSFHSAPFLGLGSV